MLDKTSRLFKDIVQTQIENRLIGFKNQLQTIEV
jgi:hypothetical protein